MYTVDESLIDMTRYTTTGASIWTANDKPAPQYVGEYFGFRSQREGMPLLMIGTGKGFAWIAVERRMADAIDYAHAHDDDGIAYADYGTVYPDDGNDRAFDDPRPASDDPPSVDVFYELWQIVGQAASLEDMGAAEPK